MAKEYTKKQIEFYRQFDPSFELSKKEALTYAAKMGATDSLRGLKQIGAKFFGAEYWEGKRPWAAKCDIAIPCATQNEVNKEEAELLIKKGCQCLSEGANMPSDPEAIDVYLNNKILYGPGKAANAGGVAVSGLEMSQNATSIHWSKEEVDAKLQTIMSSIHDACALHGKEHDFINYMKGANIAGFIKVADSMIDQGVV